MARQLVLSLDGVEFSVSMHKIDREKLYGRIEIEAYDEEMNRCSLQVLAADGRTLIDKGGTSLAAVNEDGMWVKRSDLIALDGEGNEIDPVPSSFSHPNTLEPATVDEYLSYLVKSVYLLEPADEGVFDSLAGIFSEDAQLYKFPFSYRGGLEYDCAFLTANSEGMFMVIGTPAALQFVELHQPAMVTDYEEEADLEDEELDFDLL